MGTPPHLTKHLQLYLKLHHLPSFLELNSPKTVMYTPILARTLVLALSASTLATATYQSTSTVQATNMNITLYAEPNCNSNGSAASWVGSKTPLEMLHFFPTCSAETPHSMSSLTSAGPQKEWAVLTAIRSSACCITKRRVRTRMVILWLGINVMAC